MSRFNLLIFTLFLFSCASKTELTGIWESDSYKHQNKIKRVLVVGITDRTNYRKQFEHQLKQLFEDHGIEAIASVDHDDGQDLISQSHFLEHFAKDQIDAIIFSRFVRADTLYALVPGHNYNYPIGYNRGYYDYYENARNTIYTPPTIEELRIITIEINVYSGIDQKLIWTSLSRTTNAENADEIIEHHSKAIVDHMLEEGFLVEN
ncbi:MAG: hypothetical protein KDD94_11295 [Calditrichaeota bacterium]|nr:hypothetical protein [Calditrichota bacterium]